MSHLRSCTTVIAMLLFVTPLMAQSNATPRDTAALGAAGPPAVVPAVVIIQRPLLADAGSAWVNALSVAPENAPRAATVKVVESGQNSGNTATMIVGGAGLLVGAIIGGKAGTIIMVGGGVVGLFGLWNYLK